jgi:hypothetical protein
MQNFKAQVLRFLQDFNHEKYPQIKHSISCDSFDIFLCLTQKICIAFSDYPTVLAFYHPIYHIGS